MLIMTSLLLYIFEFIKAVSHTVLDMINDAYHGKPLILTLLIKTSLLLYIFEFIKAVSDTVFDMINAVYYEKPLIFITSL